MSDRYDPRERWRWEEEREREDQGMESEGRFSRHGGNLRWGTGGLGAEPRTTRSTRVTPVPPRPEARGPYVGLGPRGYHRSDERIHEEVCERLTEHGDIDATDVEVGVEGGEVTLSGTVATRSQKRLAEDVADGVAGVVDVDNRLRVLRPGSDPSRGAPTGGGHGLHEGQHPSR
jgi:hypothetical protein